jgi:hypothetical protein
MKHLEGIVDYPYASHRKKKDKQQNAGFVQTQNEPHRIVIPDYRYVPEKLIIKPYTRSQKEAMLFNVKR